MKELIKEIFEKYNFSLNETQIEQFEKYYNYLVQENEKYNLTAITQPLDVIVKHFIDSVLPEKSIEKNATIIDIGTGAGFPGIPLKILRNDLKVTLLDSLQKRINFLNNLIEILGLSNIKAFHGRAEDFVANKREKYDYAVSRAVANLATLSEYMLPYVKVGGKAIMYKGNKLQDELQAGENAIKILGGETEKIEKYYLAEEESNREVLIIKKIKPTNKKYPRGKNLPKTKPLC